ncbi:DUF998 domain-containing protein [Plantactinospora veratri]|uniref:DUF998 domain-containing protein n=1 Tax=Plantactinospora veratri TaxID=1436122 RepID=A0ABU7SBA7_9ACTN
MSRTEIPTRPPRSVGVARPPRHSVVADAVLAGVALPFVGFAVADLGTPGWSPVERMVSHYVHAPGVGPLVPAGLLALAVASAGLLRLAAARTRGGGAGLWLLGIWSAAVLVGGIFPTDPYGQWDRPLSPAGMVHGIAGLTAFTVLPVAAVLLTRVWRRDPRWRPVSRAVTASTVLCVVAFLGFAVTGVDVMTEGASLTFGGYESVAGLAERVMLWSYALWLGTVTVGLRRLVRQDRSNR